MTGNNFTMKKSHKIAIGAFLVLGTILSAFITITTIEDSFFHHTTWLHRPGWAQKALMCAFMLDFVLMTIAGFISTVSFFRKGTAWRPILKAIITNIICLIAVFVLGAIISEIRFFLR
jgi:hypothetical protein